MDTKLYVIQEKGYADILLKKGITVSTILCERNSLAQNLINVGLEDPAILEIDTDGLGHALKAAMLDEYELQDYMEPYTNYFTAEPIPASRITKVEFTNMDELGSDIYAGMQSMKNRAASAEEITDINKGMKKLANLGICSEEQIHEEILASQIQAVPDHFGEVSSDEHEIKSLADIRRQECKEQLNSLSDRELLEQVNTHFASHPALPGEKNIKDFCHERLDHVPNTYDLTHGWIDNMSCLVLDPDVCRRNGKPTREEIIETYARTRIRETKIELHDSFDPSAVKTDVILEKDNVSMKRADVNIVKRPTGDVCIEAPQSGRDCPTIIGTVPDKFLTNNPMNVESCKGELQITDYSNNKMKNVSIRLVADTDLMSGDVMCLDEDMLKGLDDVRSSQLEQ